MLKVQQNILTGALTLIPIWVTYWAFKIIFGWLSDFSAPWVEVISAQLLAEYPNISFWVLEPTLQSIIAIVVTLIGLYILGWTTSHVIGARLIGALDRVMQRIPVAKKIYGATRTLITVLQKDPKGGSKVVFLDFPAAPLKAVGMVTTTFMSPEGEELSAVFVPTAPNPTSGYLEIVPTKNLTPTGWTFDEAMTFVVSGGAVAPASTVLKKA